jgi:hypothetical protein
MSVTNFRDKLDAAIAKHGSRLAIGIAPSMERLPATIIKHDEPLFPYSKGVIAATEDMVCGYVFYFSAFLALGAAGIIALERAMAYVPDGMIKVLHGPFAGADYAKAADILTADAVTLVPQFESDPFPYVRDGNRAVYMSHTAHSDFRKVHPDVQPRIGVFVDTQSPALFTLYDPAITIYGYSDQVTDFTANWQDVLRSNVSALREKDHV